MNNELISVIIPVYNVKNYLNKCVDSVINQTYSNLEIILVDDGSTDGCSEICDEYKENDNRIIVLHKKNGGLSDARNVGIDIAKGRYLTFVDSDDYVTNDYVEILYNQLISEDADLSIGNLKYIFEDGTEKSIYNIKKEIKITKNNFEMLELMLYQKYFDNSASVVLYKRELFDDIRFPVGKLYEDFATIYKVYFKAQKATYINKEIYYYLRRKTSIVGQNFRQKEMDLIDACDKLIFDIENYNYGNYYDSKYEVPKIKIRLIKAAKTRILSSNFYILKKINGNKDFKIERERCINNIKKYKHLNKKARLKNNIAVILFDINPKLVEILN